MSRQLDLRRQLQRRAARCFPVFGKGHRSLKAWQWMTMQGPRNAGQGRGQAQVMESEGGRWRGQPETTFSRTHLTIVRNEHQTSDQLIVNTSDSSQATSHPSRLIKRHCPKKKESAARQIAHHEQHAGYADKCPCG